MIFNSESEFEAAVIASLKNKGWENQVLMYPTEEDLLKNWAQILFENNRGIDRLNDAPLTDTEMQQIMEQVLELRSPLKLNGFINGKTVSIKRDNPNDPLHLGKEVSLKIYDRLEIAAGQSRYQIAQQPKFKSKSKILNDRRGDLMLLINGMPVIHVEVKKSGIPVSQAYHQIEKYAQEGVFSGIYSLVQVFVAIEPDETVYFANPGPDGKFNINYFSHWADYNNDPQNNWKDITERLLSIPMAHQLIGFYTVADNSDGILKVMRSYQYYAANAISDRVSKVDWYDKNTLGGYVWHTTGSGKTMTSFKSAQLIANSKDADKVIFLMDRIELGTQSLHEYRAFAEDSEEVQATEDTRELISKLKSKNPADTLIVTSIQKMSNIKDEEDGLNATDIEIMKSKRVIFIVDEAHRSTFGDMLITIKQTFSGAIFFGFTGTPIHKENQKKSNTTSTVFGSELHRYSIADGIRDKNVLGFDPYKVMTFKDIELRRKVALKNVNASTEIEAISDPIKSDKYYYYMDSSKVPMAGYIDESGQYTKGIEDYIPISQYETKTHQEMVVMDIITNWNMLSRASKFHGIFATSSIAEAIEYYRIFKEVKPDLRVTALFDPNIDNNGSVKFKSDGLLEIIHDYNEYFKQEFTFATHGKFKKDISSRLAHKKPYERISSTPEKQLDLLIVVDQMLTGFDSKWVNTLYLDKVLKYENIIQAFSRTNRLFDQDKPFGTIRYYRYPHSMERNIEEAFALYSGDKPYGLFVEHLDYNLEKLNQVFAEITDLFILANVNDFVKLPDDLSERGKFAKMFRVLNNHLEAAKIQGFKWSQNTYMFEEQKKTIKIDFDEEAYLVLALRYKELFDQKSGGEDSDVPFEIEGYLIEIDTGKIDTDYMNSRFEKFLKVLQQDYIEPEQLQLILDQLHKSFASLTQVEQKYANIFINDIRRGEVVVSPNKSFREYITDYQYRAKNDQISKLHYAFGVEIAKVENLLNTSVVESNINEYGRFDDLKSTVDREKARKYFEQVEGKEVPTFRLNIKIDKLLKNFIINGEFDIDE